MWGGRLLVMLGVLAEWVLLVSWRSVGAADNCGLLSELGLASTGTVRKGGCPATDVGEAPLA